MAKMKILLFGFSVVLLFTLIQKVSCFAAGAPGSVCLGHHAGHGQNHHLLTDCPYKIQSASQTYSPGDVVNMTLAAPDGSSFKGFLIVAHRTEGDKEKAVGTYINYPTDKAKLTYCDYDEKVVLTHKNNKEITSLEFSWQAPPTNEGDITFKYILVKEFTTFWLEAPGPVLRATAPPTNVVPVEQESFDFGGINWDECGRTEGCFLYPRLCDGSDCKAAVTYKPVGDSFVLQMFVAGASYISVGFSDDKEMGGDHVLSCTGDDNGRMSVQNGLNPGKYYQRLYKTGISDMSLRSVDGKLECQFTRSAVLEVFRAENKGNFTYDLNKEYYLFLAWGPVYTNTDALDHHIEAPTVSEVKVNFRDAVIVRGSSLPIQTQIHAILMFAAWIFFVGITTVISRHHKEGFGSKMLLGTKLWFQIHRACAVIAWCCTAASFIIIFVHVGGLTSVAELHSYVGIALMSAATLQLLAGILRPDANSSFRPLFNWGHWFLGNSSHILAAASFYLAFYSRIIPSEQRMFGVIAVSVTVGLQILWTTVFEVQRCRNVSRKELLPQEEKRTKDSTSSSGNSGVLLLVLYIITLAATTVACILSVVLF